MGRGWGFNQKSKRSVLDYYDYYIFKNIYDIELILKYTTVTEGLVGREKTLIKKS